MVVQRLEGDLCCPECFYAFFSFSSVRGCCWRMFISSHRGSDSDHGAQLPPTGFLHENSVGRGQNNQLEIDLFRNQLVVHETSSSLGGFR